MSSPPDGISSRRRVYISLAVVMFVLGIVSRAGPKLDNLIWDKYLGDALYAVMFYLCLAIFLPRQSLLYRVVATSVFVICVECFQITGIPLHMRQNGNVLMKLVSVVLGTKFGWGDMLAYFAGLASIASFDKSLFGRAEPFFAQTQKHEPQRR